MHNRVCNVTFGADSVDRTTINREGNVGFGVNRPSKPIELASGAHVTAGGVWTNSSLRERKDNILELSAHEALETLDDLKPVHLNDRNDCAESYIGFIAEDAPDLVATRDRNGIRAMAVVAVLSKVVQESGKKSKNLKRGSINDKFMSSANQPLSGQPRKRPSNYLNDWKRLWSFSTGPCSVCFS